jgi:transcriptional regulator with XRE-family HTH domain
MTDVNAELTELLRDMRQAAGITQRELSDRLGWTRREKTSEYETGRWIPKLELVGRWAAACGFSAELVVTSPGTGRPWVIELNDGPQP